MEGSRGRSSSPEEGELDEEEVIEIEKSDSEEEEEEKESSPPRPSALLPTPSQYVNVSFIFLSFVCSI